MLAKRIIPCLDIRNGRTVKGVNFVDIIDAGDPVELACRYVDEGADELVFLDITASHEGRKTMVQLVKEVARNVTIPFTVGGGINAFADAAILLESGADKVSVNSAAVKNPDLISELSKGYGSQFVVLAIDARYENNDWQVYVHGGRIPVNRSLKDWAQEGQDRGCGEILFTSMNHDGTKDGFANEALSELSDDLNIPIIASGGAGKMEHFYDTFTLGKADAALAASVFHFKQIGIQELKVYLADRDVPVRI